MVYNCQVFNFGRRILHFSIFESNLGCRVGLSKPFWSFQPAKKAKKQIILGYFGCRKVILIYFGCRANVIFKYSVIIILTVERMKILIFGCRIFTWIYFFTYLYRRGNPLFIYKISKSASKYSTNRLGD